MSRLPVLTAYDQLLHERYLEGRVGSGTFVSAALPDDLLQSVGSPPATTRSRSTRPGAQASRDEGGLGPFRMSLPALDRFPHAVWSRLVARHAHALTHAQMAYGDPAGQLPLRVAIAEHLRAARGVRCEAEQVLIVSGSQAALRLATAVLLKRGDRVAVEEPGYPGARAALGAGGAELVPVRVDEEGMSVSSLRRRGATGACGVRHPVAPVSSRDVDDRRAAACAAGLGPPRGGVGMEDDYDSEYRYVEPPARGAPGDGRDTTG